MGMDMELIQRVKLPFRSVSFEPLGRGQPAILTRVNAVERTIFYWRSAHHIHGWFQWKLGVPLKNEGRVSVPIDVMIELLEMKEFVYDDADKYLYTDPEWRNHEYIYTASW